MKTMRFLTAAAISIALTFTFSSCSSDDGDPSTGGIDEQLVSGGGNGNGGSGGNEAWVGCIETCSAWVFKADGGYIELSSNGVDGPWEVSRVGTWSTSGTTLAMNACGEQMQYPYTKSGNTFSITFTDEGDIEGETFTVTQPYTKQSNVTYEVDPNKDYCEDYGDSESSGSSEG
jgi:hypothetical protein